MFKTTARPQLHGHSIVILGGDVVTREPITAMILVQVLPPLLPASLGLTPGHAWDLFHPS